MRQRPDSISELQSNRNNVFQLHLLITAAKRRHHDVRISEKPADRHDRVIWSARDMVINEYAHLSPLELCELTRHLTRSEQDIEKSLAACEKRVREAGEDRPDPIRKRLFFLLLKHRRQRRAVEKALATSENADRNQPFCLDGDSTAASSSMSVAAPGAACPTTDAHPDPGENLRKKDPTFYSTGSTLCIFESDEGRAPHVPAGVPRRTRDWRVHVHGVTARIRAACTRLLAALAGRPRFDLPGRQSTS
jgi:hypothetical protein